VNDALVHEAGEAAADAADAESRRCCSEAWPGGPAGGWNPLGYSRGSGNQCVGSVLSADPFACCDSVPEFRFFLVSSLVLFVPPQGVAGMWED
jgi:hypothetical protein